MRSIIDDPMVLVIDHPLITHKLTQIRKKETGTNEFRKIVNEIGGLIVYEITRDLELEDIEIETPVAPMTAKQLAGEKLVICPILRAGLGMVDGILQMLPSARVGHIGLYRDEKTLKAVEYFAKFPNKIEDRLVIIVDPMLATGGSAVSAIDMVKKRGTKNIKFVCLVAAPEGVRVLRKKHPDVPIYIAALDERLNEKSYIVPGLGDCGDRIFGTK